jgi:anti-sigma regulatory factor (Ser/Thr protein kinase)/putative methionine-R-sulfoxide reductase with GAF domain
LTEHPRHPATRPAKLGVGQTVLRGGPIVTPFEQVRNLYRLSDPALSELSFDELLAELLERVREALDVDTVAILLLDEESNELVARAAKGIEEEVEQGVRIPLGGGFAGRIAVQRVPIFIADVGHAEIINPLLREKGIRSLLGVPLIVEGKLVGVMHVGSLHPRTFRERDVSVLQLAAARAAPAIERAQLYAALEREHHVATVLQRSLLPRQMPAVVGVSVAARYLPARDEVGGDWYDVIELPRGSIGIVIGDVVGHGIGAAALMGQLRTALRAYALEGNTPGRTLELVDRYLQGLGGHGMATAAYGVFDPIARTLRFATAGHLPPIITGGGSGRVVDIPPAPPLGAFPYISYPNHDVPLEHGETILLYTDGLVERPRRPLGPAIDELVEIASRTTSVEDACVLAVDRLVAPEGPRDDVAIVAMQNSVLPDHLTLRLPARPTVLADVRNLLRRWLDDRGATPQEVSEITIAVSEACANAVEHAYSPGPEAFEFEAKVEAGEVTLTVRDHGRWRPPRGQDRGRGLTIIGRAMRDFEVNPTPDGTELVMRRRLGAA